MASARLDSARLTIGMIDTSVARHPSLSGIEIVQWPAGDLASAPMEHGTAVASILAKEGGNRIYAANIFRGPSSRPFTSADVIAQALEWMIEHNVPIVNMSLAGPRNAILDRLVRDAVAQGHQVVAAAGNGGPTAPPAYPAAVPGVIAVTAVDKNLRIYRYANHGRYISVAAKGVAVVAARSAGGFAEFNGTSFATPHVTAWMARCRAGGTSALACGERMRQVARDLGTRGFDEVYGHGFID
jgi:subtilisin family serine protease